MKSKLIFLLFLFNSSVLMCQEASVSKQRFSLVASIGQSTFAYKSYSFSSSFPAPEFRLGANYSKLIFQSLKIKTGLVIGAKIKRKSLNSDQSGNSGYQNLDQVVSGSTHWFAEVPFLLQYDFRKEIIGIPDFFGIRAGISYRMFGNRGVGDQDFFQNKSEPLAIVGLTFNIHKKTSIGLDYYKGLTNITSGQTFVFQDPTNPTQPAYYDYQIKNKLLQVRVEYHF